MPFFQELSARGLVKQATDESALSVELNQGGLTFYVGFDPTSDSLHVGSLLGLMTMRRLQKAGHRPIAVVGGATGMIGDPSGKTQERVLLTAEDLERNLAGIRANIERFLNFSGPCAARVVNNADWFRGFAYVDFLREIGKHFTVNHMIAKESVRARLEDREHGISYTEFSYMLLQAYDFHVLHRDHGCRLQFGGSDQWGNIVEGIELIRRLAHGGGAEAPRVFGFTHPLIAKADGTKFGKSESGTVWLDARKTSAYRFYQFWLQTADADAGEFLRFFSERPLAEIEALEASLRSAPEKREAQRALARELTTLAHGASESERVVRASESLFGGGARELDERSLREALEEAPVLVKRLADLDASPPGAGPERGIPLADLVAESGLCPSKGQARKDIAAGGIYVNDERAVDGARVGREALLFGKLVLLRKGKRTLCLVRFE